jgi:hypothetical protein
MMPPSSQSVISLLSHTVYWFDLCEMLTVGNNLWSSAGMNLREREYWGVNWNKTIYIRVHSQFL